MSELKRTEYDFTGVAESEQRTCAFYEYARESELYRKIAAGRPKKFSYVSGSFKLDATFTKADALEIYSIDASNLPSLSDRLRCEIITRCPGFPDTPWLDLPARVRRWLNEGITNRDRQIKRLQQELAPFELVSRAARGGTSGPRPSKKVRSTATGVAALPEDFPADELITATVRINLLHEAKDIASAFKSWLRTVKPPRAPGRFSNVDRLHALALMRLRFYCRSLTEAQRLIEPLTKVDDPRKAYPKYSERKTFKTAANSAVRHFQELLGLTEKEKPRRYTEGWKDKRP